MYIEPVLEELYNKINYNLMGGKLPLVNVTIQSLRKSKQGHGVLEKGGIYCINIYEDDLYATEREIYCKFLHEIVHLYCRVHDIKDTSRDGRYHNAKFKNIAEMCGLVVLKDEKNGHVVVDIKDEVIDQIGFSNLRKKLNAALEQELNNKNKGKMQKKSIFVCPVCKRKAKASSTMKLICGWDRVEMVLKRELEEKEKI